MDLPSSRHLTRKCKVLIQILADVFAFILSYAVSIVFSRFNASDYAAYSAVVCIVTLIMLCKCRDLTYCRTERLCSIQLSLSDIFFHLQPWCEIHLQGDASEQKSGQSFEERIPESCCIRSRRYRNDACTSVFQWQTGIRAGGICG